VWELFSCDLICLKWCFTFSVSWSAFFFLRQSADMISALISLLIWWTDQY
jgi:hypothetical protein